MLEKIKKILDPKLGNDLAYLGEMKKRMSELEAYIAEHEDTEDEGVLLKVLTSKNTLKRLSKELPDFEERMDELNKTASLLIRNVEYLNKKRKEMAELEEMKSLISNVVNKLQDGLMQITARCFSYRTYNAYENQYDLNKIFRKGNGIETASNMALNRFLETLTRECDIVGKEIEQTEEFLSEYPKVKKILKW